MEHDCDGRGQSESSAEPQHKLIYYLSYITPYLDLVKSRGEGS